MSYSLARSPLRLPERPCHECGEMKRKDAFTKAQWKQETYRVCKECTAQKREAGTPYRCAQCGLWHAAAHFKQASKSTVELVPRLLIM